jgi:hypothetical protein
MIDFFSFTGVVDQPQARIRITDDGNYSGDVVFFARNQGAAFTSLLERMRIFSTGKVWMRTIGSNTNNLLVFDNPSANQQRIYTDALGGTTPADLILGTFPNGQINQLVLKQNSGNVGIGSSSPAHKLHVAGSGFFDGAALEGSTSGASILELVTQGNGITPLNNAVTKGWAFWAYGNSNGTATVQNDLRLSFFNGAGQTDAMYFDNGGQVGIGTINPSSSYKLNIFNPSGAGLLNLQSSMGSTQITMDDNGANDVYLTSTLGDFDIWTGGNFKRVSVVKSGNVGINNTAPTATLDVAGTFKLADGSQGTDRVLTSDGLGNATWQNSSRNTGFSAFSSVAQTINGSTWTQINFSGEEFDDGNDFASNQYVAPTAGVYHFNASVSWTPMSNTTGYSFIAFYKNGAAFKFRMAPSHTNYHSNNISETMKLNAGDVITVWVAHFSTGGTATTYISSNLYTYFDGHRLY